jgi:hypothetical protein
VKIADETIRADDDAGESKSAPIRVMLTKGPEEKNRVGAFVENLAKWRDATLVLAGLAYVLGYLSWAIYVFSHGLGLAPVLDAQYFAAGVLPTAIVIASCFVAWWLRRLSQWIRKPVSSFGKTIKTILEVAGLVLSLVGFILLSVSKLSGILIGAGMLAMIVSSLFSREKTDAWYHRSLMGLAWVYLPLGAILGFFFYTTTIFPGLPQAFGGPRPQCVELDLDAARMSANTLHLLAPEWQSNPANPSQIVRSRHLDLVFQTGEYLFLQTSPHVSPTTNQVIRLKSSAVESVFPVAD